MAVATRFSILNCVRSGMSSRAILSSRPPQAGFAGTTCSRSRILSVERGVPRILQKSLFHSSAKRFLLPALPQRVDGTANDPVVLPEPSPTHGSYHWTFERLLSAALVPLTIAPFAAGSLNPIMDAALCGALVIHSHVGFQSVIIDYVPAKRLPKIRVLFWWGLRAGSLLVAIGLYEFETNDVGITEAIKKIWAA